MKFPKSSIPLALILGLTACNDSEFKADVKSPAKAAPIKEEDSIKGATTIYIKKDAASTIAEAFSVPEGALDLKFDAVLKKDDKDSVQVKPPLSIYFAFDRSSSMGPQLESAKKSMQSFSDSLESNGFKANFGAAAFVDVVSHRSKLINSDPFKNFLSGVPLSDNSEGNVDFPEGGFAALLESAKNLEKEVSDSETVPVIIYVSDALAHKGGASGTPARDCKSDEFEAAMGTNFGKRIKLFYSVRGVTPESGGPCTGFSKINDQYDQMMSSINKSSGGDYRGAKLAWPFNENTLSKELPKLLTEKIVSKSLICQATKVDFSVDGTVVKSLAQADIKQNSDGTVMVSKVLEGQELENSRGSELNIKVTRCCDQDLTAECKQPVTQSVNFKISKDAK